jgi:ATP-dependent helicase/DNAse subunit B
MKTYKYAPYSYSKIATFSGCPHSFNLGYIQKIKVELEEESLPLLRGRYIHDRLEFWGTDKEIKKHDLNEEQLQECENVLTSFSEHKIFNKYFGYEAIGSEIKMGLSKELKICNYGDKENCLFRGKIDKLNKLSPKVLNAIDWKTGKYREQGKQLKYYATWCFLNYPEVETVIASFVFVEHNKAHEEVYTRKDLKGILQHMFKKINRIEAATIFKRNPTRLCEYCDFYKGGHCKPKF